jgi:hypothetical protein
MEWGEQYASAWNAHTVEALVALHASDCRYTDVPFRTTWEGMGGCGSCIRLRWSSHPDGEIERHGGVRNGQNYVWKWTWSATVAGEWVSYRGVSVGTLDDQDRVVEQRDYWNPKDILSLGATTS